MKTVEMPKMGDTMEEGKILRWMKKESDQVKKGDALAEVETEKVNIEIEAFANGILRKILVPEGQSAPVGAGIALIGTPDEPLPEDISGKETTKAPAAVTDAGKRQPVEAGYPQREVQATPTTPSQTSAGGRIFISPIARRI